MDGPLPLGDVVGLVIVAGSALDAAESLLQRAREPKVYHRVASASEASMVEASGELWGQAPRNTYASDIPQVKAYTGRLPAGKKGYEFTTAVPPDPNVAPGRATWSGRRPGVTNENGWAKIPVRVISNRTTP